MSVVSSSATRLDGGAQGEEDGGGAASRGGAGGDGGGRGMPVLVLGGGVEGGAHVVDHDRCREFSHAAVADALREWEVAAKTHRYEDSLWRDKLREGGDTAVTEKKIDG